MNLGELLQGYGLMDLPYHSILDTIQGLTNTLGSSIQVPCITKGLLENWPVYSIAYILQPPEYERISTSTKISKTFGK